MSTKRPNYLALLSALLSMTAFFSLAVLYHFFPKKQEHSLSLNKKKERAPQEKKESQRSVGSAKAKHHEGLAFSPTLRKQGTIQLFRVKHRKRLKSLRVIGEVEAPNHAIQSIGARAAGRIVRFFVEEGSHIKKGQALLQLDSPAVGKARSRYLRMRALWELTKGETARQKRLRRLELNSVSQLAKMEAEAARAKIEYDDAIAQLRILGVGRPRRGAEKVNGLHTLYAMRQGALTHIHAKLGQWVTPETSLLQIEDRRHVWIHLRYPLALAPVVKEGMRVSFTGAGLPHTLYGNIEHISEHVIRDQQNLQARVDLPNPKGLLRPGQLLEVHLPQSTEGKEAPLLVPDEAVQHIGLSSIVFLHDHGHAVPRKVIVGASQQGWSEILFGLQKDEVIISRGAFLLKSIMLQTSPEASHKH